MRRCGKHCMSGRSWWIMVDHGAKSNICTRFHSQCGRLGWNSYSSRQTWPPFRYLVEKISSRQPPTGQEGTPRATSPTAPRLRNKTEKFESGTSFPKTPSAFLSTTKSYPQNHVYADLQGILPPRAQHTIHLAPAQACCELPRDLQLGGGGGVCLQWYGLRGRFDRSSPR